MKRKGLIALIMSFVMMLSVFATACGGPKTIEEYINSDSEAKEQVQQSADAAGLTVDFSGNDIIYTYDIAAINGVTEEVAKSDVMIDQLSAALEGQEATFVGLCKQLEEQSKIEGIQMIVNYTFGEEVLVTKTFNSSGLAG